MKWKDKFKAALNTEEAIAKIKKWRAYCYLHKNSKDFRINLSRERTPFLKNDLRVEFHVLRKNQHGWQFETFAVSPCGRSMKSLMGLVEKD